MARRIGAYVALDAVALKELADIPKEMIERVVDLSPVMAVVATDDLKPDMLGHLDTQGEQSWAPKAPATIERDRRRGVSSSKPGVGEHGGFAPTVQRSWSKRNAVAFTKAPHAHLFSLGTQQYRTLSGKRAFAWGGIKSHETGPVGNRRMTQRRSRAGSRAFLLKPHLSSEHQPARPFDYISKDVQERSTRRIAAFIVEESYRGSV